MTCPGFYCTIFGNSLSMRFFFFFLCKFPKAVLCLPTYSNKCLRDTKRFSEHVLFQPIITDNHCLNINDCANACSSKDLKNYAF